jgi:hypothetical protein
LASSRGTASPAPPWTEVALGLRGERRRVELGLDRLAVEHRLVEPAGRRRLLRALADHLHARVAARVGHLQGADHALDRGVAVRPLEREDRLGAGAGVGLAKRLDRARVQRPLGLSGRLVAFVFLGLGIVRPAASSCHSAPG